MSDPRDWPGAARERATVVAELAELEAILREYAPASAWCRAGDDEGAPCPCYRCRALRICRYGVR